MEDNYLLESNAVICNLSGDPSLFPSDCLFGEGNILVAWSTCLTGSERASRS